MPTYAKDEIDLRLKKALDCKSNGNLREAAEHYQAILKAKPDHLDALHNLGSLCLVTGQPVIAETMLVKASQLLTSQLESAAAVWLDLARAYRLQAKSKPARTAIDQALLSDPNNLTIHIESGHLYSDAGSTSLAINAYLAAYQLDNHCAAVYYSLSFLQLTGDYQLTDEQQQQFQQLVQNIDQLDDADQILIYFAHARLLHKARKYSSAFKYFEKANQTRKRIQQPWEQFEISQKQNLLERTQAVFQQKPFPINQHKAHSITAPITPIFIVGMPRTGTTLLETCLSRHPQVAAAGELVTIKQIANQNIPQAIHQDYPEQLVTLPPALTYQASRYYLQQLKQRITYINEGLPVNASMIIDKMPTNFEYLGLIIRLFPHAPIIHTTRDPMDTLWSCYQQSIAARYSNDFIDLEGQYRCYREFMKLWKSLGVPMIEVNYENMVTHFEQTIKDVIAGLGLPWSDRCLDTSIADSAITTASRMQVRKPIHTGSIGSWRNYEDQLQPLYERLADFY